MELKKISFCDTTCYNICSNSFKEKLLKQISDDYHLNLSDKSIRIYDAKRHQQVLYKNPFVMSVKSIGNTYYIYLTTINGVNSCFLIDKKIIKGYSFPRIILAKYRFCDSLFSGTLIEADLIKANSGWKFLLSDLFLYKNKLIREKPFHYRLTILGNIFTKHYIKDPYLEPCSMFIKKYFPYNKAGQEKLVELLENIDYKSQGICFTSEHEYKPSFLVFLEPRTKNSQSKVPKITKILTKQDNPHPTIQDGENTHRKSSPCCSESSVVSTDNTHNTNNTDNTDKPDNINTGFTFKITKTPTPGIYQLYCQKVGKIIKHSVARIDGLSCLKFVQSLFTQEKQDALVLCHYDEEFKKFIPKSVSKQVRPDEYTDIIYFTHEKM